VRGVVVQANPTVYAALRKRREAGLHSEAIAESQPLAWAAWLVVDEGDVAFNVFVGPADAGDTGIEMARRQCKTGTSEPWRHRRALIEKLRHLARRHGMDRVFADFIELSCCSLSNAVDKSQFAVRESRYHEIRKRYTTEELQHFSEMLALLALVMEEAGFDDVLGGLFMTLDLGSKRSGQVFTPYPVSRMMAMVTMGASPELPPHGFFNAIEPACGAGGIVVAMADTLHQAGMNYQRHLHVTCIDIDLRCVHMTYLQVSLLHIPAIVVHGNALSGEVWDRWYTPAHVLGRWGARLDRH